MVSALVSAHNYARKVRPHFGMSACLQRSQRRSQCAIYPVCISLAGATGKEWAALDGAVSRRSAPAGSESGLADSACSPWARPLDGVDTRQIVWLLSAWLCWLVTKSPSDPRQPQTTDDRVAVQPS